MNVLANLAWVLCNLAREKLIEVQEMPKVMTIINSCLQTEEESEYTRDMLHAVKHLSEHKDSEIVSFLASSTLLEKLFKLH